TIAIMELILYQFMEDETSSF
ncbi:TPA: hypothetical protein ACSKM3_002533, partial [Listeria monocytogenes]